MQDQGALGPCVLRSAVPSMALAPCSGFRLGQLLPLCPTPSWALAPFRGCGPQAGSVVPTEAQQSRPQAQPLASGPAQASTPNLAWAGGVLMSGLTRV